MKSGTRMPTARCAGIGIGLLGLLLLNGCRFQAAERSIADPGIAASFSTNAPGPAGKLFAGEPLFVDPVEEFVPEPAVMVSADPGLAVVESERGELRDRVKQLAESQIGRAKTDLEQAAEVRLDARRRELQEMNDRELGQCRIRATAECVARIREVELELQSEKMNLDLKMAALRSRRGLFGGKLDAQTEQDIRKINDRLEQLDKRRAESVESANSKQVGEIAAMEKRLRTDLDAEMAKLRRELASRANEQAKSLQDRLQTDLSSGVSERSVARDVSIAPTRRPLRSLMAASQRASDKVDSLFQQDLARAAASTRKRQLEIRRRQSQDAALIAEAKS